MVKELTCMNNFILCLLLLLSSLPLLGQKESLLIGPGDMLHVQFYDTPELEQHSRVDDAGNAPMLFLGKVHFAGDTPTDAAIELKTLMIARNIMRHPQVVVTIEQYATQDVTVVGEISRPGLYPISTPVSVLEIISMAGGFDALSDRHILIHHQDRNAPVTKYYVSNDPVEAIQSDVRVRPGDTVLISKVSVVYVLGDVGRPGGYPMSTNDSTVTFLQSLAMAGSPNHTARVADTRLIRKTHDGYVNVPVHVSAIENGKQPDPLLRANDVIYVPFSFGRNFVLNGTAIAASVASAALYTF
jgi:polysaccharide export outer membrane protein